MKIKDTDVITIFGQRGSGKSVMAKYLLQNYPRFFVYDPLNEYGHLGKVVTDLDQIDLENDKRIIFNPIKKNDDLEMHDIISGFVWEYMPNTLFATDEMQMYQSTKLTPNFKKVITQGRHKGIGVLAISQRFANLNQTILTQSHHVFIYSLFGRDIESAKSYFGKKIEESINSLPEYAFIYWNTKSRNWTVSKPLSSEIVSKVDSKVRKPN